MKATPLIITAMVCATVIFVSATHAPAQNAAATQGTEGRYQVVVLDPENSAGYAVCFDTETGRAWKYSFVHNNASWRSMGTPGEAE